MEPLMSLCGNSLLCSEFPLLLIFHVIFVGFFASSDSDQSDLLTRDLHKSCLELSVESGCVFSFISRDLII